jgi:hypothetical protein
MVWGKNTNTNADTDTDTAEYTVAATPSCVELVRMMCV